jgi:uncharacterized protein (TIGR03067 family)
MKRRMVCGTLLVALLTADRCFASFQSSPDEPVLSAERTEVLRWQRSRKELLALQGTWAATCGQTDGTKWSPAKVLKFQLVVQGERYCISCGERREEGTIRLLSREHADLLPATGAHAAQVIRGIFRVERDRLVLCLGAPNQKRPSGFSAEQDSECVLIILRRVAA